MRHPKTAVLVLALFALLLIAVVPVFAEPIAFIHESVGSGTIGATAFGATAPVPFTIMAMADTDDRQAFIVYPLGLPVTGYYIDHLTASISIEGVGEFDFEEGTRTEVNNTYGVVVFGFDGLDSLILLSGPAVSQFLTWDMLTSIGPISTPNGMLFGDWFGNIQTDGGTLHFNGFSLNLPATFQAVVGAPIPEPTSLLLLGTGLGVIGIAAWRRRK